MYWPHTAYYAAASRWRSTNSDELRRSVLVSGAPRSGTTWLGNVVAEMTGWPWMEECTGSTRNPGLRELHGWNGRPFRDPDADDPTLATDLEQVLTGRYLGPGLVFMNRQNTIGLWSRRPMICKLIDVSLMLPWIAEHLEWLRIVQIVRHPFDVAASRHALPATSWSRDTALTEPYLDFIAAHPEYDGQREFSSPAEVQVATWAIEHAWLRDNMASLRRVHWIRYEDLRRDPGEEVGRLAAYLGLPTVEPERLTSIRQPSRTTNTETSSLGQRSAPVWQERYDRALLDRMEAIVAHYGYPFYGPDTLNRR